MKSWIALSATLCTVALIAVAAVPASAHVPGGQGLAIFGVFDCGDFDAEVYGPPALPAANAYLLDTTGNGPHVVATRFEIKSPADVVLFEKNFGTKAGLTTIYTCTQPGDFGDVFTLTVGVVPPKS
jgi:hypothetical protein